MKRTEIAELGEFGLIERLTKGQTPNRKTLLKGPGDDAAVIDLGRNNRLLLSADCLAEGVHFDLSYTPLKHLGYKAVAVNVSDICAMNAEPREITLALAVSNRFSVEALEELYQGVYAACKEYNIDLVGGDITSSLSGLVINVTVTGYAEEEKIAYRSGAKPGDALFVTGDLGAAYLGLHIMEREKQVFKQNPEMQPELKKYEYLAQRLLRPQARLDAVFYLKRLGVVPTAMIDVSDGLASELMHIGKSSGVGVYVYEEDLPVVEQTYQTALEFNIGPTTCAMNGGEDYELLFSVRPEDEAKLSEEDGVYKIGRVTPASEGWFLESKKGNKTPLEAQGWKHF